MTRRKQNRSDEATDRLAWFAVLVGAKAASNRINEARAREGLRDLGVRVQFMRTANKGPKD